MRTADFDYDLPPELIAQTAVEPRDHARLLVLHRDTGEAEHHRFYDLPRFLSAGDVLVLNRTRVLPARLLGTRPDTGGKVEVLLLRRRQSGVWEALVRPARRLRVGARFLIGDAADAMLEGTVLEAHDDGTRVIALSDDALVARLGQIALPPYIRTPLARLDRYQTVYARDEGSVAAPTAGLHFTPELLQRIQEQGVEVAELTLHIGLDTFRPVQADDPRQHKLHTEFYSISLETAERLNAAKSEGRRVICVGTTSVRAVEQAALRGRGQVIAGQGWAELFILPGHQFRVVDALLTNFHLPRSSLLMLVSAFVGRERILAAYREAISLRYRFYSFGDCMLLL